MRSMSAENPKSGFAMLSDYARAEPVMVKKYGRAVMVVISVEEFERLNLRARQSGKGIDRVSVCHGL